MPAARLCGVERFFRRDGGQSVVELALTLPLLVFALMGGADMARAFALQIAVENGSRAGAESYAIDSTPTNAEAQAAAIAEINRTPTAADTEWLTRCAPVSTSCAEIDSPVGRRAWKSRQRSAARSVVNHWRKAVCGR